MPTLERLNAWEELGTVVDPSLSAIEALEAAGLAGWNMHKEAAYFGDGNPMPGTFANVRTNPATGKLESLGTVGNHYDPVQNEAGAALLEAITDESGAKFSSLGQINGGRKVFISMKLPDAIKVGGTDAVDLYLSMFNSHDGQSSFQFMVTPMRVFCANMQQAANAKALSKFSRRHTRGGTGIVLEQARTLLDLTFAYVAEFELEAQKLFEQEYTNQAFARLTASLYPTPEGASARQKETNGAHRANLSALFTGSPTAKEIAGTRWGAYQAVTEYLDHEVVQRGKAGAVLKEARALQAINPDGVYNGIKNRAWSLLTQVK